MTDADVIQPSASIASTGLGIRYIGKDHCYAFSGTFPALDSTQTVFDFDSGSGYIVATLTMTAPVKMAAAGITDGAYRGYNLAFNSQTVFRAKLETDNEDMPSLLEAQILIPPFTAVVLTCVDHSTKADYLGTSHLTGRVYGAT